MGKPEGTLRRVHWPWAINTQNRARFSTNSNFDHIGNTSQNGVLRRPVESAERSTGRLRLLWDRPRAERICSIALREAKLTDATALSEAGSDMTTTVDTEPPRLSARRRRRETG